MKKLTALLLSLILIVSSLTGCFEMFTPGFWTPEESISLSELPEFDGETPYVYINGNSPYFTEEEKYQETSFER